MGPSQRLRVVLATGVKVVDSDASGVNCPKDGQKLKESRVSDGPKVEEALSSTGPISLGPVELALLIRTKSALNYLACAPRAGDHLNAFHLRSLRAFSSYDPPLAIDYRREIRDASRGQSERGMDSGFLLNFGRCAAVRIFRKDLNS